MKKIISYLLTLMLVIGMCPAMANAAEVWDGNSATEFSGGDGSTTAPYEIATAAELALARDRINANTDGAKTKHYKITADIDLCNVSWTPIALSSAFAGSIEGNGHVIKNVNINITANNTNPVAFIARLSGTVKNLGLDGVKVYNADEYNKRVATVGGFAGLCSGTIENCYLKNAEVKQKKSDKGEGQDDADNKSTNGTGAFIGSLLSNATIKNCYVYNTKVAGGQGRATGGFYGNIHQKHNTNPIKVENCYAADVVYDTTGCSHSNNIGTSFGFGYNQYAGTDKDITFTNCYSTMDDKQGSFSGALSYNSNMSVGTVGAVNDAVSEIFSGYEGYELKGDVNEGYPCLSWEIWNGGAATSFAGGNGEAETPYEISNAAELMYAQQYINGTEGAENKHYKLTADIDFKNKQWNRIGNNAKPFNGTFDGNKHVVKNLFINVGSGETKNDGDGFFGDTGVNAVVKDFGLDNIKVTIKNSGSMRVHSIGAMVGNAKGSFENCFVKNSTVQQLQTDTGEYYGVGAFAGRLKQNVSIKNCYTYNVGLRSASSKRMGGFFAIAILPEKTYGTPEGGTMTEGAIKVENCYAAETYIYREGTSHSTVSNDGALYGFGSSPITNFVPVNCFGESANVSGKTEVTESIAKGTAGADKDIITTNLVTSGSAFKTDLSVNGGYPALSWEKKPIVTEESKYIVSAFSKQRNEICIIENENVTDAQVYVVAYDSKGRFVDCQIVDPMAKITPTVTGDKLGVFVWNENISPLAKGFFVEK